MTPRKQRSLRRSLKLKKYSILEWEVFAALFPVIFTFKYAKNEENKRRGRAGRIAGFRQGTTNLNFVPTSKHPRSRNPDRKARRYYDLGRKNWRAFRASENESISVTAFWSESKGEFVDTAEEALSGVSSDEVAQEIKDLGKAIDKANKKRKNARVRESKRQGRRLKNDHNDSRNQI